MNAQVIYIIENLPLPNLVYSRKWWFLLNPLTTWVFSCVPQNDNDWNFVEIHEIFTDLCFTYLLFCTWYSRSVHLSILYILLSLPWSINLCARVGSEIYFWNTLARLIYVLTIAVYMTIRDLLVAAPVSCTVATKIVRKRFH